MSKKSLTCFCIYLTLNGVRENVSSPFVKVFGQILDSSISENYEVRHIFEDLLKLADWRTGVVDMTPQAISRRLNIPIEKVLWGIEELCKPDPDSRSKVEEGRRLKLLSDRVWGWHIVNYLEYRQQWDMRDKREYDRAAKARERARKGAPQRRMKIGGPTAEERTYVRKFEDGEVDSNGIALPAGNKHNI